MADGETLWSIARRYEVTVDAVREANEMESETIRPGQTLRIPRASSTTASATRTESGSSRSGTAASAAGTEASSRPAASAGRASGEGSSSASRPSSSASGSRTARAREHTVGEGETLWGIARRYETTVDSLRRANDLEADAQIQPGQKLSIPEN